MSDSPYVSSNEPRSSPPAKGVEGRFHDRGSVIRAVEGLAEKSVPADSIRVFVIDESGARREVSVEDESGAMRGALIGAGIGAVVGVGIVVMVASGRLGPAGVDVLGLEGIAGALRAVLAAAVAGVPLGALLGMGHWRGRKKISKEELDGGTAVVVVESEELSELARITLEKAGAVDVTAI